LAAIANRAAASQIEAMLSCSVVVMVCLCWPIYVPLRIDGVLCVCILGIAMCREDRRRDFLLRMRRGTMCFLWVFGLRNMPPFLSHACAASSAPDFRKVKVIPGVRMSLWAVGFPCINGAESVSFKYILPRCYGL